jgi:iron complex transport system substrate-binding protein
MNTGRRVRSERRLAAILAADVTSYSRLIGADEEGTLDRIRSIRADVIDPKIAEHHGRLVKTTGDGLLVEFGSVVDALRCATEVQQAMARRNSGVGVPERIEFRIGISVGDVVVEDGDIFGDGVNVAARLEGLAEPGGICVSARVQEDAAGKLDVGFDDMGEQDRIVGISGYCVRPPEARREKPRVSAFTSADIGKILDLRPDLVLSFSDLQADIVAALIRQGAAVHAFNQRAIAEIFDMIRLLGALVGAADRLTDSPMNLKPRLPTPAGVQCGGRGSRWFISRWDEPMISGIAWVPELIEVAGGIDIFADRSAGKSAKDRMVTTEEIIAREPDVIIGSWCGKKFRPEKVTMRPGFERVPAVRNGALYEIRSPIILQPGPAALTDGLKALQLIIEQTGQKIAATSPTEYG